MIPNPASMPMDQWAAIMREFYPIQAPMPRPDWREWANQVVKMPPFSDLSLGAPATFPDFRSWAVALANVYPGGVL